MTLEDQIKFARFSQVMFIQCVNILDDEKIS